MHDLIPITHTAIDGQPVHTCDARDLHEKLGVKKYYADWIKAQIKRGRLVDNRDYSVFHQEVNSTNQGVPRTDYCLTLDAAKHVAMLSSETLRERICPCLT